MSSLTKWVFIALCLLLALASYGIGFSKGILIFVGIGILFELGFWVGIFQVNRDVE